MTPSLKVNGRDAKAQATPARPRPQKAPVAVPDDWDDPYADPFPPGDETQTPELRASYLADAGIWAQQMVSEIAALARKTDRLTRKLEDPKHADDPRRPGAIKRARALDRDLIDAVRDAAWHEASCDRTWQSLTAEQRRHANAAAHWMTDPATPRLIGRTWAGIGAFETWPRFFRVRRAWMQGFPFLLITDMKDAGVWTWRPSGADPPDPFGGDLIFDPRLAQELEGRR